MIRPNTRKAYDFFHRSTLTLSKIEANGIQVDTDYLDRVIASTAANIALGETALKQDKVFKLWRRRFRDPNLDSNAQLGTVLTELGYTTKEKTDKGNPKWDESTLDKIDLDFLRLYTATKKLKKTLGTYLYGIKKELVGEYLHPSYNLAGGMDDDQKGGAMSYRGSVSNPNFSNMPVRNKTMGEIIRRCFIARRRRRLVEVDFSTIEVRVAACCCLDPRLIAYVKDKSKDMHRDAAMQLFLMTQEQIGKKTTRDAAKNKFVFPQFYGSYYLDCAKAIWESMLRGQWKVENSDVLVQEHLVRKGIRKLGKCDPDQPPVPGTFEFHVKSVQEYLWNTMFPVFNRWRKQWYETYLETGVVPMPTGFVAEGYFRKNQVLNLPIQGPAYHCLQWSINEIQDEIERRGMKALIVGLIHDCLLGDVPDDEVQEFLDICENVMTRKLAEAWDWIVVPMEIEVDVVPKGESWHTKKLWVKDAEGTWAEKA